MTVRRVTPRFVLHAGYACNARCTFCYYLPEIESGQARDFTTAQLFRRIDRAARWGKTAVDISGGEPTIRPDLPALIGRCRERGIGDVTIITNGMRTSRPAYVAELARAGLTDGLFSIHGATASIHDGLTKRNGSFASLLASLPLFRERGLGVRVNHVLTGANLDSLEDFLGLLEPYGPDVVNLLVLNPAEQTEAEPFDYRRAGAAISAALDLWKPRLRRVNVRFLPFCALRSHPECVKTQWQKAHEAHEWDPVLNVWYQKGALAAAGSIVAGTLLGSRGPSYRAADVPTALARSLSAFRMTALYRQGPPCRGCSLRRICPGLPAAHVRRFGFPDLTPVVLDRTVTDPLHFDEAEAVT